MALVHARPLALTRGDRVALAMSAAIAGWVADRVDRRARRVERAADRVAADETARMARDAQSERAHLLGLH